MATRADAIAKVREHLHSGKFLRELDRRVSYQTESQNPGRESALRAYLEENLQPAFAELDLRSLQALIHRILESRRQGGELTGTVPSEDPASDAVQPERAGRKTFPASRRLDSRHRHRDYWTGTLTASVIGLAVLLGWMMGRAGWNMAVDRAQQQIQAAPEEIQPGDTFPASSSAERPTGPAKPIHSTPALPAASKLAPKPKVEATEPVGGLVMSENGRVVFRMLPSERTSASEAAAGSIQTDVTGKSSPSASAQIANPNDE